jgi:cytochrome P450
MQCASEVSWDPADTDGFSEDWLERLLEAVDGRDVIRTPVGLLFAGVDQIERLLAHPLLKVPVVEQYELMGVSEAVLERAKRVILGLDGARHTRLRRLVSRAFTQRAVERLADTMRDYLIPRLDAVDGEVDFIGDIVGDYPAAIIGGLLGLPPDDLPHLTSIAEAITSSQFSMDVDRAHRYLTAAAECDSYLTGLVAEKRRTPGDDILTRLTRVEVDGDSLTDAEIVSLCASLMNAGIDTTRNQASLAMTLFATFPQQWDHLRADPSLVGNAVEEVLRYLPVTPLLTRLNTEPMTFDGVEIAERTYISLGVAAANRSAKLNSGDPTLFDVTRPSPRHFTFGHGAHFCLGAALARLEMRELFSQLIARFGGVEVTGKVPRRPVMGVYGVKSLVLQFNRAAYGRR